MNEITIIRGDTCEKNVSITGVETSQIEAVYFTSKDLEIDKTLTYNSDIAKWVLRLEASETATLKRITTDYDITIKFVGDDVSTVLYRGLIRVLPKVNKVGDLSNE